MENKKRIVLVSISLIVLLSGFFVYQYFKFNDGKLHLVFCNVGQGDGIFVRTPKGKDILIDAGPDDSILSCLSNNMPFWDRKIDLMILSHPHQDHARGMIDVLKRYRVLSFATEEVENDTALYKNLKSQIRSSLRDPNLKLSAKYLYSGDRIKTSDGVTLRVLGPSKEFLLRTSPDRRINESEGFGTLITLLSYKDFNALLTSDAQVQGLKEAIDSPPAGGLQSIEVFQVPHHGSKYGIDEEILNKINPKVAVFSVGKNSYGHPSKFALDRLKNLKVRTLRTDQNGEIKVSSDGEGIAIQMKGRGGD